MLGSLTAICLVDLRVVAEMAIAKIRGVPQPISGVEQ